MEDISKLRVVDLKKELSHHGLSTAGLKADLVKRLQEFRDNAQEGETENGESSAEASQDEGAEDEFQGEKEEPVDAVETNTSITEDNNAVEAMEEDVNEESELS